MFSLANNARCLYSVMQSDGNSVCGDAVLNSFNKASRDEDNILDQIYIEQKCPNFYYDDFLIYITLYENAY